MEAVPLNPGFFSVKIETIRSLSPSVNEYSLQWMGENHFTFTPGQFVMLDLPIGGTYSARSYSIATAPRTDGSFELCIVQKPGGVGTDFLFNAVKSGDILACSLPQGSFVLPAELPQEVVFICTGTGIAPFRAMLQSEFTKIENSLTQFHLLFGCRTQADLLYFDEWQQLAQTRPNFHYYPVLSRDETWAGYKGYVHQVYQERFANIENIMFYLCGWSNMVKEAKNNLKAMGYHRRQIKFELYD